MNRLIWAPALCLALGAAGAVRAAPQVEADPNKNYPVTPELGPWMVSAAYFTGPLAPDMAKQLALEIRLTHNAPAYVFNYAAEERRKQQELIDQQRRTLPFEAPANDGADYVVPIPRRQIKIKVEEQCAVMIGAYPDESTAHAELLCVKQWPQPAVKYEWVAYDHGKEMKMNPYEKMSMVVRNPTVPHDSAADNKYDYKVLTHLNADEPYSMLRCPGKWTLAVKEYVGLAVMKPEQGKSTGFLEKLGFGKSEPGESLVVAGNNAHELARTLERALGGAGVKPYVLHTKTSSVVSIGAFNAQDDKAMEATARVLAQWRDEIAGAAKDPNQKDPLGLFPTPVPIEVPHP